MTSNMLFIVNNVTFNTYYLLLLLSQQLRQTLKGYDICVYFSGIQIWNQNRNNLYQSRWTAVLVINYFSSFWSNCRYFTTFPRTWKKTYSIWNLSLFLFYFNLKSEHKYILPIKPYVRDTRWRSKIMYRAESLMPVIPRLPTKTILKHTFTNRNYVLFMFEFFKVNS